MTMGADASMVMASSMVMVPKEAASLKEAARRRHRR